MEGPRGTSGGGDDKVTPPQLYFNRRRLLRGGVLAASSLGTGWLYSRLNGMSSDATQAPELRELASAPSAVTAATQLTPGEPLTSQADITHYNNFYEFTTDKDRVADVAARFDTSGWRISVEGLVKNPRVFDLDDVRRLGAIEERVYRMRCVEAWSMVIPWAGLPLAALLGSVEPSGDAVTSRSRRCSIRAGCRGRTRTSSNGRMSKACGSTKRCTR